MRTDKSIHSMSIISMDLKGFSSSCLSAYFISFIVSRAVPEVWDVRLLKQAYSHLFNNLYRNFKVNNFYPVKSTTKYLHMLFFLLLFLPHFLFRLFYSPETKQRHVKYRPDKESGFIAGKRQSQNSRVLKTV